MGIFYRNKNHREAEESDEDFDLVEQTEKSEDTAEEKENILKLKIPIMINNEEVHELPYDFDRLTAKDLHAISTDLKRKGISVAVPAYDIDFQIYTFAKAVALMDRNVFLTDILRLSASDTMKATALARSFLSDSDSTQSDSTSGD